MAHPVAQHPGPLDLSALLSEGELCPVPRIAERVLGRPVDPRTALRWAIAGRRGVRLPTVRGARCRRCTTERALRAWLLATSDLPPAATADRAAPVAVARRAVVDDAVLASYGLGRQPQGGRK